MISIELDRDEKILANQVGLFDKNTKYLNN